jgi:hypothetical protein
VLQQTGSTDHLMAWWPTDDRRPHLRATVTVRAPSPNAALARVMTALHEASEFEGAELTYDLERPAQRLAVTLDDITVDRELEVDREPRRAGVDTRPAPPPRADPRRRRAPTPGGACVVPETMKAVQLTGHGGLDQLVYREDVPVPSPAPPARC